MIKFYTNDAGMVVETDDASQAHWVAVTAPSTAELLHIEQKFCVPLDFLQAPLDIEEKSRIELEDDSKLIMIDIPTIDSDVPLYEAYSTLPLAIIIKDSVVITVCLQETSILNDIIANKVKNISIHLKTRFVFKVLIAAATRFLFYLNQIERTSVKIENRLNKNLKNEELLQLLALTKSLIYFAASLTANQATLKKIQRGHILRLYEEDKDLLEDVIIEFNQAIDMANSYLTIIKATMETYSSVASNNLNIIMKVLAVITIVLTVPDIIFAFYGMNTTTLPLANYTWFPIVLSVVSSLTIWLMIKKAKFYK